MSARIKAAVRSYLRPALRKRQKGNCAICGEALQFQWDPTHDMATTFDHIVPRSLGGTNVRSNLRLTHRKCNIARGNEVEWPTPTPSDGGGR